MASNAASVQGRLRDSISRSSADTLDKRALPALLLEAMGVASHRFTCTLGVA
jgi:hypothetical protein